MSQAQYLNGYDDGYADAMKKIKASAGQGGGSDGSSSPGRKLFVVTDTAGLTIDGDSIPSEGAVVMELYEGGSGGLNIDGNIYLKGSGPSIFVIDKPTPNAYTVTLFNDGLTVTPENADS